MRKQFLVAALACITAIAAADQSIYSTKLDNGWANWSWAKVTMSGKLLNVTAKD